MDFVRVRLSPVCRDLGESGDHRSPPAWYGDGWAALTERYHSSEWDGVVGQVQKRLVAEDPGREAPVPRAVPVFWPVRADDGQRVVFGGGTGRAGAR